MRLPEEQYVANFTIVAREDDKDDDGDEGDGVLLAETEITTDMDGMEIELPAMETDEE
jgi:hypothetical protein